MRNSFPDHGVRIVLRPSERGKRITRSSSQRLSFRRQAHFPADFLNGGVEAVKALCMFKESHRSKHDRATVSPSRRACCEVTLLIKKPAPTSLRAGFFERFGFDFCCNSAMACPLPVVTPNHVWAVTDHNRAIRVFPG